MTENFIRKTGFFLKLLKFTTKGKGKISQTHGLFWHLFKNFTEDVSKKKKVISEWVCSESVCSEWVCSKRVCSK